jgi:hypothetical protein
MSSLTSEELAAFERDGFVQVRQAFPREAALAMQAEIWSELEEDHGIARADTSTWKRPPHSPHRAKFSALNQRLISDRFVGAISDLLGGDGWKRPRSWGGFLVTFPADVETPWDVPTEIWHWDGSPTSRGLLIFSLFSEVLPGSGGTLLLSGSHRLVESHYASLTPADLARPHKWHRKTFSRWDPWLEALTGRAASPQDRVEAFMKHSTDVRGVPSQVVELTGEPGDAVFCNLRMLHCVAPNRSDQPRFGRVKFMFLE